MHAISATRSIALLACLASGGLSCDDKEEGKDASLSADMSGSGGDMAGASDGGSDGGGGGSSFSVIWYLYDADTPGHSAESVTCGAAGVTQLSITVEKPIAGGWTLTQTVDCPSGASTAEATFSLPDLVGPYFISGKAAGKADSKGKGVCWTGGSAAASLWIYANDCDVASNPRCGCDQQPQESRCPCQ